MSSDFWIIEVAKALKERNEIEIKKLEFDKEVFEFNKQLNIDSVKANTEMSEAFSKFMDDYNELQNIIKQVNQNQFVLYNQIKEIQNLLGIQTKTKNNEES